VRSIASAVPLFRALRIARSEGDRGALALYALLGLVALLIAAEPFSRSLALELSRVHHFTPSSLPRWIGLQIVPKPYAFSHRVWFASQPLDEAEPEPTAGVIEAHWLNHYPGRVTRFETVRASIRDDARALGALHLLARSTYRGTTLSTAYEVRLDDGGLVVTRRGAAK